MNPDSYKELLLRQTGNVLRISLNRPASLNAIGKIMHSELARVFTEAAADDSVDILVLTGEGAAFSAGGDIEWMRETATDVAAFEASTVEARMIVRSLVDIEKPVICRMNGDAVGLGATIALFCDVIIAADHARICDPHVRVGLVAGDGGAVIWPLLVGYARAKEYLMTGDTIAAPEAARMGLINHAHPAAELDQHVDKLVRRLAGGAAKAIGWTKASVNIGLKDAVEKILDTSLRYEIRSSALPPHKQAVDAFLARSRK